MRRDQLIAAVVGLAAAAVAGCSGGDEDGVTGGNPGPAYVSPLDEYLGPGAVTFDRGYMVVGIGAADVHVGGGLPGPSPSDEELRQQRDYENRIAECMAAAGFEYIPVVDDRERWTSTYNKAWSLPKGEFVEQYGYGVSTLSIFEDENRPANPNDEIRAGLSESALAEYERALTGSSPDERPPLVERRESELPPAPRADEQGYMGQAGLEVSGETDTPEDPVDPNVEFAALREDLVALGERYAADPRLDEPTRRWADCMADAGYPGLDDILGARGSVWDRLNALDGWLVETEDCGVIYDPKQIDPADLSEVQKYEIDIAAADQKCYIGHYVEIEHQVRHDLETEFVEQHRDELERYRDWRSG